MDSKTAPEIQDEIFKKCQLKRKLGYFLKLMIKSLK